MDPFLAGAIELSDASLARVLSRPDCYTEREYGAAVRAAVLRGWTLECAELAAETAGGVRAAWTRVGAREVSAR